MAPSATPAVHAYYQVFLLYIEPLSALAGALAAGLRPATYLALTHAPSAPAGSRISGVSGLGGLLGGSEGGGVVPLGTSIALAQLANLYLFFALTEALVLRSTADLRVWRALLLPMLIADFGHLLSVASLGWEVFYDIPNYNAMDFGNVLFVYAGAATRIAFLLGFGVRESRAPARRKIR